MSTVIFRFAAANVLGVELLRSLHLVALPTVENLGHLALLGLAFGLAYLLTELFACAQALRPSVKRWRKAVLLASALWRE